FARVSGLQHDAWLSALVYLGIGAVGLASGVSDPRADDTATGSYGLFATIPLIVVAAIPLVPILRNRTHGEVQKVALSITGFLYIGWMFGHLGFLANAVHPYAFVCYVIFATEITDISAFTFGRLFGRRPLRSEISPRKTVEGALGALAVAMLLP